MAKKQTKKEKSAIRLVSSIGRMNSDPDMAGFRQLSTSDSILRRDLTSITQEKMVEIAYWLWENSPLAKWIIEVKVAFLVADGLPIKTDNEQIEAIINEFWHDPVNQMDTFLPQLVRQLRLYGEVLLPTKEASNTGILRMGYIDPSLIDEVVTDPENVRIILGVILKSEINRKEPRKYKVLLPVGVQDFVSEAGEKLQKSFTTGECFYFAVNTVSNSPRGRSDLLPVCDWLDLYEEYLYNFIEKWTQQNLILWDLLIKTNKDTEVTNKVTEFGQILNSPNSIYGHNESIEINPHAPDMKSIEADKGARLLRNHILGCLGYPSHWYGGGEDVNKASSTEMAIPTFKMLSSDQRDFKYMLKHIIDTQLHRRVKKNKIIYNKVKPNKQQEFEYGIVIPELNPKDLSKFGAVIKNVADGLAVSQDRNWLDIKTTREVLISVLEFLGKEISPITIEERLKEVGNGNFNKDSNSIAGSINKGK